MKADKLINLIGSVDNSYIDELFEEPVVTTKKKGWRVIAASLAIVVAGTAAMLAGISGTQFDSITIGNHVLTLPMAQYSVVMIDVNPSIRLEVNDRNIVVKATAVNDDAKEIIDSSELVGKSYDKAISSAVSTLQDKGYITELKNSILVSILDADEEKAETMRVKAVKVIKAVDRNDDYGFSVLSQVLTDDSQYKTLSAKYNVSSGRIALIEKICAKETKLSIELLAEKNVQTLNQVIAYVGLPDEVNIIGNAAGVVPTKYRDNIDLSDLDADDFIDFICAVSDFYTKLSEYYDEKDIVEQIGYVFDILEGESTDGEKLWGIIAESRNQDVGSLGALIRKGDTSVTDWYNQKNINKIESYINEFTQKAS